MTVTPSAKNLVQPQDPQKVHPLHRNLHLATSTTDRFTTQDIINASSHKSTCHIIYDSPTAEQFLNFFIQLFNQGVSHSVLISPKSAVAHALGMKYQHIPQHPSVIKYFKASFNLRPHCQNFLLFGMYKLWLNILEV